jgi:methyl-accepting chemotaxis protein
VTIRTILLLGFLLVIAISAATGVYSISVIGRTSALTAELYDRPLMASSFALSATADFAQADRALVVATLTEAGTKLHEKGKAIAALESNVTDDLNVVEKRFRDPRGAAMIGDVRQPLAGWDALVKRMAAADPAQLPAMLATEAKLRDTIDEKLDILVEGAKEDGLNFREDAVAVGRFSRQMLIGAVAVTVACGIFIALLIARRISRPIVAMTRTMSELAAGDTEVVIPAIERRDEVGQIAKAVEVFKRSAIENLRLTAAKAQEQAIRDRRQAAMDRHTQEFGTSVSGVMASMVQSAADMRTAASDMSEAAKRTRDSTTSAVESASVSARNLNSVAVAAEEMAVSSREISQQVAQVTSVVRDAVECASETDAKVASLADAADRIGDVVRLITDIAGQTNLLALNATIEAARAGDAGKGFAVVAGEVKVLAAQTARATDQIGAQIGAIRSATGDAVSAVRRVGAAIGQVDAVATAIAAAVEQQAAATQEISGSVQNVTRATGDAAQAMAQVLSIAGQTDSASQSVLTAADEVGRTAETLRVEVNDFLSAVAQDDADERRNYERVPGAGTTASLTIRGYAEVQAVVQDISRGGVSLMCDSTAPSGTEVEIGMSGAGTMCGRVVRSGNGRIAVAFRQDAATQGRVDLALGLLTQRTHHIAA